MNEVQIEIDKWLRTFAQAVRNREFEQGKTMFSSDVVGFGTVCPRAEGMDSLFEQQWSIIWPSTNGFEFDYESAQIHCSNELASIAITWSSDGTDDRGKSFERKGRCTLTLKKTDGCWLCVHSHFSMNPA